MDFDIIIKKFGMPNAKNLGAFGEGHINSTFLVENNGEKYILQKISSALFPDPKAVMDNIYSVTEFLRDIVRKRGGNPDKECLTVILAEDKKPYCKVENGNYRLYKYIDGEVYQVVKDKADFYQCALAFGDFTNALRDFDCTKLKDILPDFHNTEKRYKDFENSVEKNLSGRAKLVEEEIKFVKDRKEYASKIVNLIKENKIPERVTHNDTKLNNVMFRKDKKEYLAVIDFDTIMTGSLCYDFGDAIRYGCNPVFEDEKDLSKVVFNMEYFEEFTKGYLKAIGENITKEEKDNLAFSAILMTYECGMRFLADFIDGDKYFHISREGQNLDRARTQFKLILDMEKNLSNMQKIVEKY